MFSTREGERYSGPIAKHINFCTGHVPGGNHHDNITPYRGFMQMDRGTHQLAKTNFIFLRPINLDGFDGDKSQRICIMKLVRVQSGWDRLAFSKIEGNPPYAGAPRRQKTPRLPGAVYRFIAEGDESTNCETGISNWSFVCVWIEDVVVYGQKKDSCLQNDFRCRRKPLQVFL